MLVCSNVSSVLCHLCSFKFLFFPAVWQRSAFGVLCSWCSLVWWCWLQCLISFTSSLLHEMKRCRDWICLGRLVVVCVCERRDAVSCSLFYRVSMCLSLASYTGTSCGCFIVDFVIYRLLFAHTCIVVPCLKHTCTNGIVLVDGCVPAS